MKKLILALTLILPMSAFADVISFECSSATDMPGAHKFEAHGVVSVDDLDKVEGIATIITEKSGEVESVQTFSEVNITGYIHHYATGEMTVEAFDQLVLQADSDYLRTLNLLLGIKDELASRVLSVDNFSYRSNCKILERFHQ